MNSDQTVSYPVSIGGAGLFSGNRNPPQYDNSSQTTNDLLGQLLGVINGQVVREQSFKVNQLTTVDSDNVDYGISPYQVIAEFDVPFAFNAIELSVLGYVVNVTANQIQKKSLNGGNVLMAAVPSTPVDWIFGSYAFTPNGIGNENNQETPIVGYGGPQLTRFATLPAGHIVIWVSPLMRAPLNSALPVEDFIQNVPTLTGHVMMMR
jgi:hypothetical protein